MSLDDRQAANCMFADNDTMVVDSPPTVSLGQQSIDSSHEGGEYADFQDLAEQVMRVSGAYVISSRPITGLMVLTAATSTRVLGQTE
jgi:hypothetical protein